MWAYAAPPAPEVASSMSAAKPAAQPAAAISGRPTLHSSARPSAGVATTASEAPALSLPRICRWFPSVVTRITVCSSTPAIAQRLADAGQITACRGEGGEPDAARQ